MPRTLPAPSPARQPADGVDQAAAALEEAEVNRLDASSRAREATANRDAARDALAELDPATKPARPAVLCAFCGRPRDLSEVIRFWPVDAPDRVEYVCRPSPPKATSESSTCFAQLGPASQYAIAGPDVRTSADAA